MMMNAIIVKLIKSKIPPMRKYVGGEYEWKSLSEK